MHPISRAAAAVLAAAAASSLGGCCELVRSMCPFPVPETPKAVTARDTPLASVDFLIDAFRRRAPNDIYATLHPAFVEKEGGFSAFDFANAYTFYEDEFQADAVRLAAATKEPPRWKEGTAWVHVHDGSMSVWLVFVNRPASRVVVEDDLNPEIRGAIAPLDQMVEVRGDTLVVTGAIPLQGQGDFVEPGKVRRVELFHDWLLYRVHEPKGIRFVDKVMEDAKGARR